jgi:monofunctional biosynthetic peptidoglycan transglycosylase
MKHSLLRWSALLGVGLLALQVFFGLRVVAMLWLDPQSTAFERSQAWQLASHGYAGTAPAKAWVWRQQWQPQERIAPSLSRAVIASEDSEFAYHGGVEWEAVQSAWRRNAQAQQQAPGQSANSSTRPGKRARGPKVVGGSTITQQLAKNLFLSGERTLLRKGQELVITLMLEAVLDKPRIMEIYLNHVEWGSGIFGAQAAAQRYFGKNAAELSSLEAARLAVMLPRPRYFEKLPNSDYLAQRANVIVARMPQVELP